VKRWALPRGSHAPCWYCVVGGEQGHRTFFAHYGFLFKQTKKNNRRPNSQSQEPDLSDEDGTQEKEPEMSQPVITLFAMTDISSCQLLVIFIRAFHQSLHFSLARLSKRRRAPFLTSANSKMAQSLSRYKTLTRRLLCSRWTRLVKYQ